MHNSGFSMLEKQLLALHFNGSYISNFDFKEIAKKIGVEVDLADREKMFKNLLKIAREENKEAELYRAISDLLVERMEEYRQLSELYPKARDILGSYIQKTRSTIMLLQQRSRMNPYE